MKTILNGIGKIKSKCSRGVGEDVQKIINEHPLFKEISNKKLLNEEECNESNLREIPASVVIPSLSSLALVLNKDKILKQTTKIHNHLEKHPTRIDKWIDRFLGRDHRQRGGHDVSAFLQAAKKFGLIKGLTGVARHQFRDSLTPEGLPYLKRFGIKRFNIVHFLIAVLPIIGVVRFIRWYKERKVRKQYREAHDFLKNAAYMDAFVMFCKISKQLEDRDIPIEECGAKISLRGNANYFALTIMRAHGGLPISDETNINFAYLAADSFANFAEKLSNKSLHLSAAINFYLAAAVAKEFIPQKESEEVIRKNQDKILSEINKLKEKTEKFDEKIEKVKNSLVANLSTNKYVN